MGGMGEMGEMGENATVRIVLMPRDRGTGISFGA